LERANKESEEIPFWIFSKKLQEGT
jgi:hypothetical protein